MSEETRLAELVVRWEQLRDEGREITPEELCQESPQLLSRLSKEIDRLRRSDHELVDNMLASNAPSEIETDASAPAKTPHYTTIGGEGPSEIPSLDAWSTGGAVSIPGYRIFGEIDRGGMGVIVRARDLKFDRDVAIKLMHAGAAANSSLIVRFRVEARITGQLQHPGIPAVHDLGELPDGRPFMAMKLVGGRTLHELLNERSDPSHDRGRFIAIFEQICQTVGYAHAHGVIHRDLKPQNVMVGAFGEVQVMDWGLAKRKQERANGESEKAEQQDPFATDPLSRDGFESSATRAGSVMGTPAYMPPEQAAGEVHKLNAQSDVFGLGAILCQILIGRPPYRGRDSHELRIQAMRGDLTDASAALEACDADPGIVTLAKKCLAFNQEDRPSDGVEVATEVARFRLAAEARARTAEIEGAAALAREAEQRRRRRALQWAFGAVAIVLLLGIIGTTMGLLSANAAADKERTANGAAQVAKMKAEKATKSEAAAKVEAQKLAASERAALRKERRERERAEKVSEYVINVFRKPDPSVDGRELKVVDMLDRGVARLGTDLKDEPAEQVRMLVSIGMTYDGLGLPKEFLTLAQRASDLSRERLADDDEDTYFALNALGLAHLAAGDADQALRLFEKCWKWNREKKGADHFETIVSLNNIATAQKTLGNFQQAISNFERCVEMMSKARGENDAKTLTMRSNLAATHELAGDSETALSIHEQCLERRRATLGTEHPDTLVSLNNVATSHYARGDYRKALPLLEECLPPMRTTLGDDHPDTIQVLSNLAMAHVALGASDKAIPLLEECLGLREAKFGTDHPDILQSLANLGAAYCSQGEFAKAIPFLERCLERTRAKLGEEHPDTFRWMNNLAVAYMNVGQLQKAFPLFEKCLERLRATLGDGHPDTLTALNGLALAYYNSGDVAKALPLMELSLRQIREKLGENHPTTLTIQSNVAEGYKSVGDTAQAIAIHENCLERRRATLGVDHPDTLVSINNLGMAHYTAQSFDKAIALLEECLKLRRTKLAADNPDTLLSLYNLASAHLLANEPGKAAPYLEECYSLREAKLGENHPDTLAAMEKLGTALLASGPEEAGWLRIEESIARRRRYAASDDPAFAGRLASISLELLKLRQYDRVEAYLRECLTVRERIAPDAWVTFSTKSMLGGALAGQRKFEEAEPLLLEGLDGMKTREESIPPIARDRLTEARQRLVELYDAWGKPDEAARWRAEGDGEVEPPAPETGY